MTRPTPRHKASVAERPALAQFSDDNFRELQRLAHQYAGVTVPDNRRQLAYSRVAKRMFELRIATFEAYLEYVKHDHDGERVWFVHAITTHFTRFFREPEQLYEMEALASGAWGRHRKGLQFWSAGCSSGEEAYSIAMVMARCFGRIAPQDFRVFATDVDKKIVDVAARGVYPHEVKADIPQRYRRYLLQGTGKNRGLVRIAPELCSQVEFAVGNLSGPWPARMYDAIFCRNVMIYFTADQNERLLARFAGQLRPGGFLFIGHSERIGTVRTLFESCGNNVFQLRASE